MAKEKIYLTRHDLGSLLDGTFRLIKPTGKSALAINAIVWIPASIVIAVCLRVWFAAYTDLITLTIDGADPSLGSLAPFLVGTGILLVGLLVQGFFSLWGNAALTGGAWAAIAREKPPLGQLLSGALRRKLPRFILLALLQGLIYLGFAIIMILLMVGCFLLMEFVSALTAPATILVFLLYLGFYAGIFFLRTCLHFSFTALAIEDIGARKAVSTSFRLVKGNFWRTFGITFLFEMIISTVVSILSSPFIVGAMVPFFIDLFRMAGASGGSDTETVSAMMSAFSGPVFTICIGLAVLAEGVLDGMVRPLFNTMFYVDLKVRKGELADTADYQGLDSGSGEVG